MVVRPLDKAEPDSQIPRRVADPEHLGGKPRVAGTRVSIGFLLETLACGMTIPEIVKEYPSLTEEAIKGALEELAHPDWLKAL